MQSVYISRITAATLALHFALYPEHTHCATLAPLQGEHNSLVRIFDIQYSQNLYAPRTVAELQALVKEASSRNKKIALVGTGKSQGGQTMSSLPDSYRISLHNMNKLIYLDVPQKQVTVEAATTLHSSSRTCYEGYAIL